MCVDVCACRYQREMKTQPKALEMLFGLVTDLFVDKHKFKGHSVSINTCTRVYYHDAVSVCHV